jgi:hypothetical protein
VPNTKNTQVRWAPTHYMAMYHMEVVDSHLSKHNLTATSRATRPAWTNLSPPPITCCSMYDSRPFAMSRKDTDGGWFLCPNLKPKQNGTYNSGNPGRGITASLPPIPTQPRVQNKVIWKCTNKWQLKNSSNWVGQYVLGAARLGMHLGQKRPSHLGSIHHRPVKMCCGYYDCLWVPVTTAWHVLRLQIEERPLDMEGSCEYIE